MTNHSEIGAIAPAKHCARTAYETLPPLSKQLNGIPPSSAIVHVRSREHRRMWGEGSPRTTSVVNTLHGHERGPDGVAEGALVSEPRFTG